MEGGVLEYPDLFNIVIFKVHADLVKMGKISEIQKIMVERLIIHIYGVNFCSEST